MFINVVANLVAVKQPHPEKIVVQGFWPLGTKTLLLELLEMSKISAHKNVFSIGL